MNYRITLYNKRGKVLDCKYYPDQEAMYNDCLKLAREWSEATEWHFENIAEARK